MVSGVDIWTLKKDLCRCCHAEGKFDNLATPQTFMNQEEIYSDMIKYCFDIEISPVPGSLCTVTYSICPNCIIKLREAMSFKRQVQLCEKKFLDLCHKKAITVHVQIPKIKDEPEIYYPDRLLGDDEDNSRVSFDDDYSDNFLEQTENIKAEKLKDKSDDETKSSMKKKKLKPKTKKKRKKESESESESMEQSAAMRTFDLEGAKKDDYSTVHQEADGTHTYTCKICSNTYKRKDSVKQHYRHVHLKQRPRLHGCYYCPEKVAAHLRAQHMETAHGIPAPTCGACGKKFAFPFQVVRHQKTFHMGEKNFVCPVCGMSFGSKANLQQHVVKHTTERPFKCDFCDEAFKWKKHLRRHVAGHLNKKKR